MTKKNKLKNPVEFFGNWAEIGKDEGMEKGHANSVQFMLNKIIETQNPPYSFIDAGCGNGWVVRKVQENHNCNFVSGIDGAKQMIEKAKSIDPKGNYFCENLINWNPNQKYGVVHSMEVFYYFENPEKIIQKIYDDWLKDNGILIFGIDHYEENKSAINWPEECGVFMNTMSIKKWKNLLLNVGFKNIQNWQVGQKDDWAGTLVFLAEKYN